MLSYFVENWFSLNTFNSVSEYSSELTHIVLTTAYFQSWAILANELFYAPHHFGFTTSSWTCVFTHLLLNHHQTEYEYGLTWVFAYKTILLHVLLQFVRCTCRFEQNIETVRSAWFNTYFDLSVALLHVLNVLYTVHCTHKYIAKKMLPNHFCFPLF